MRRVGRAVVNAVQLVRLAAVSVLYALAEKTEPTPTVQKGQTL